MTGQDTGDSASALTVDSAAEQLAGLLSRGKDDEDKGTDDTAPPKDDDEDDSSDDGESEGTDDEGAADENDDEDGEGSDDETDDSTDAKTTHKVKVDDKEIEVDLGELKAGYSRTSDYTRKTQTLAAERRTFESERETERSTIRGERQRYVDRLTEVESALGAMYAEPDWDAIRKSDPDSFADTHAAWQQHQKRVAAIKTQREAEEKALAEENSTSTKAQLERERSRLVELIPEWKDTKIATKEQAALFKFGKEIGFSDEELRGITDSRAVAILRKAMKFDAAQVAAEDAKLKAKPKLDKVKTVPPGAPKKTGTVGATTRAKQRLAKTGRTDDAASAIASMLR